MMKGIPEPTSAPKPTAPSAPTSTTAPTPKPATTVKPGDFGTTMGPGPTFKGGPVPPPITRQSPQTRVPDRSASYQRAWDNRNNPLAKGRIRDTWSKMSPEERTAAKEWAKANNKNWQEMGLPESVDVYDQVLNFLLNEGCTLEESNYIMTYVVEQGMHPQEIVARGIANILGLDKPHPTEIFARGLKKMLYPNKPVEVKAPKPPAKPAVKPAAAKPETPKFGPIPPLPPIEKKPSIADTLKDIRGSIEKSKERQKETPNK